MFWNVNATQDAILAYHNFSDYTEYIEHLEPNKA